MRAKRLGANGNRGARDSGRNDPVPIFFTPKIQILQMSKLLLLKIYSNFSISDIHVHKDGITNDKLSKRSTLYTLNLGQCMIKWNSSSTSELHNLHILCSTGNLLYRPLSISRLQLLIRNVTNVAILHLSTSVYKYFSASKLALSLRYVLNLFLPLILSFEYDYVLNIFVERCRSIMCPTTWPYLIIMMGISILTMALIIQTISPAIHVQDLFCCFYIIAALHRWQTKYSTPS